MTETKRILRSRPAPKVRRYENQNVMVRLPLMMSEPFNELRKLYPDASRSELMREALYRMLIEEGIMQDDTPVHP